MNKTKYVQFSKRIVVAVTLCVTVISVAAMVLTYLNGQSQVMADIIKMYIQYAMIVFAAYSGNSALEKWVTKKYEDSAEG